jgi:hypothetical protein
MAQQACDQTISVFIKLLSGELLPLEIDSQITHSLFIDTVYWLIELRSRSQLTLSRLINDEFLSIQPSDQLLLPQSEEIFIVFIDPFTYSTKISLASTEVWDDNRARYELFDFTLQEYDGSTFRTITQGIYTLPHEFDTTPENITFFLENDQIPAQRFGRFGDEWDIDIPQDMIPFRGIQELIDHSPLGDGLSDSAKQRILYLFSEKLTQYLDIEFRRDQEEEEEEPHQPEDNDDQWM